MLHQDLTTLQRWLCDNVAYHIDQADAFVVVSAALGVGGVSHSW